MTTRVEMELHAGMRNHSYMYNRDAANQHPMSAITGLNDKLAGMGSVVEMTAFTDAMNAATVDGPAVTVTSPTTRMTTAMWNELAVGKYIIGPEGVKIFRCTAKTETSFSAVCVSVANLRGEKGDKGDTGNTGPKGDAYEITSADYEAIAEIVEDEYTAELSSVKNDLRTLERKNKALTDLLNGQELRFDTESITGASIDVASGCVADSILKVCGKSIVQDGTIVSSQTDSVKVRGKNLIQPLYNVYQPCDFKSTDSFVFSGVNRPSQNINVRFYDANKTLLDTWALKTTESYRAFTLGVDAKYMNIVTVQEAIDSTNGFQMERGSTATTYSPYSLRTITTSFPTLKSAGSVSDYIDLASARPSTNAGKSIVDVHRLVGSVDLGSLSWNYVSGGTRFYSTSIDALVKSNSDVNAISNCVCNMFETNSPANTWNVKDNIVAINNGATSKILVRATSYGTDATAFKTAMNGVILLYEKATPTTETLEIPTDLLNAINVEAGGQITFVDHTSTLAMPITTTNEWVVRNEEV